MRSNSEKTDSAFKLTAFARRSRFAGYMNRFAKDDNGTILVLSIYFFLLIVMFAGIGVDMIMFERDRSRLQSTSDRASLAAADLDQTLDPEAVVEDYFAKEGLSDYLISVNVDEGLNYRTVSVVASSDVQTNFMHMTGVESLTAVAGSTAEERIDGVEISMVLDVSGSMGGNNRLVNLKVAARDFIDNMYENSAEGKTSISIVPYATQVSAPQYLFDELIVSNEHNYSRCITFTSDDFNTASIDINSEMKRAMHFDPWSSSSSTDGRSTDPMKLVQYPVCENDPAREMMVLQDDTSALKSFISDFEAGGNTSIDVGMKWGAALLDPSMKPVIENLVGDHVVSENFIERPETYASGESLKIIVLMTDGQNTSQYYVEDEFRSGDSNIWWNDDHEEVEKYSVYIGLDVDDNDGDGIVDEGLFYWPHDETWNDHAYGNGTYEETTYDRVCKSYRRNGSCRRYKTVETISVVDEPGQAEIVSYADLWAYTHLSWNSNNNYAPWMGYDDASNDWFWGVFDWVGTTTKNARTKSICDAAKDESILIYTIAFEAPQAGEVVLQDCASSDGHFFSVDGLEIADAFNSIASSIRKLRLTQ